MHNTWLYILVMFVAVYAVRVLPLTLIQKPIKNRFVKSFLYYVPYVTLAVMTFPAIVDVRDDHTDDAVVGGLRDGDRDHVDVGFFQNVEDLLQTAFPVFQKDG